MSSTPSPVDQELTEVSGYYNPNTFKLRMSDNGLGLNLTLEPGAYLLNSVGHKINDPRLEKHVGTGRLARTLSKPCPIIRVGDTAPTRPTAGFSGTTNIKQNIPALPPVPQTDPSVVPPVSTNVRVTSRSAVIGPGAETVSSSTSFRAMSLKDAQARGLVKPVIIPNESSLPDALPQYNRSDAKSAPHIDEVLARDARSPAEAARLAALAAQGKPAVLAPVQIPTAATGELNDGPDVLGLSGAGEHEDIAPVGEEPVDVVAEAAKIVAASGHTIPEAVQAKLAGSGKSKSGK